MTVIVSGNVHATDQVPDNQVWTPATATFFYGQPKANISCKFLGTPYGVYWMKGILYIEGNIGVVKGNLGVISGFLKCPSSRKKKRNKENAKR